MKKELREEEPVENNKEEKVENKKEERIAQNNEGDKREKETNSVDYILVSTSKIDELLLACPCRECGKKVRIIERKRECDYSVVVQCEGKERHQYVWSSSARRS